ncbi:transglutaminase-like cysteine peptidase [Rhodoferax sp. 4810]|uniref:Transglutaminase-like cysteine peptidase n=1 Tax=Thiospirillum jenense TaxID=1653858 RepID=A0A839H5X7_9GAMM|nr:transglutaminase-like cysteine peptidase [Thiospirillum jenense]MBB1073063.1 transglutaminase-like cysteine peptidase [Rhodoferax jenense]MBB1125011.1 transglutaminase-like cysteine peptidase [Thiospirillum jenense]
MRMFNAHTWLVLSTTGLALVTQLSLSAQLIASAELAQIIAKYGRSAGQRVAQWQVLMNHSSLATDEEKLQRVNDFFNQIRFIDDAHHWRKEDYWATPLELLTTHGGDCEDFAIAKYFTLLELGVDENKLRMTYVTATNYNQPHMVLTYFAKPNASPLVLDNLNRQILPATQRDDLVPVYSFNGTGLWMAKTIGSGKQVGNSAHLNAWQELKQRMQLDLSSH